MIRGRHFLSVEDFTKPELEEVVRLAATLKEERGKNIEHKLLDGKTLAMIFLQPSNRTRLSFEIGMFELGGTTINIRPEEIKLGEREPISDVSRVMSRYVDAVMMRFVDILYSLPFMFFVILLMVLFPRSFILIFVFFS